MTTETQVINLDEINANALPELQGWKEKQENLLKENPFIEIVDNTTYSEAKKNRTALVSGRTEIQKQEKLIASKLKEFRSKVSEASAYLIKITIESEEKQQAEVKRYESEKEEERLEKARLEEERKDKLKAEIDAIFNQWKEAIKNYTYQSISEVNILEELSDIDSEQFEEFSVDFNEKTRILTQLFSDKKAELDKAEFQRIEAEKLEAEKKRFAEEQRLAKEKSDKEEKERAEKQALIDAEKKKFEKEKAEYEEKKKVENFKFRKKVLLDLGFEYHEVAGDNYNFILKGIWSMFHEQVAKETDEGFEEMLKQIKEAIKSNEIKLAKEKKAKEDAEKQAKITAEKELKLEKARQKRIEALKPDKEKLSKLVESIQITSEIPELKDEKLQSFLVYVNSNLEDFKADLNSFLKTLN